MIALIGVCCVAVFQTKTGSKQKEFKVNGPALQHATSFPQFIIALLSSFAIETHGVNSILDHPFQKVELIFIIISGFIAVSVNVCSFGLIGRTSAVTYQVVGHVKTILIFVFGLIMLPPNRSETQEKFYKKIAGLVISMVGIVSYTFIQLKEKSQQKPNQENQNDSQQNQPFFDDSNLKNQLDEHLDEVPFEKMDET